MSKKEVKTNAMRMLDRMKIPYEYEEYECDEFSDGIETADKLGYDHKYVYKTLVTTGKSGGHYVFVIPIEKEIDFKKAAKVVGEKSLEMLHLKELTKVTGYVRGGCTSIGMKKQFPTVIQEDAKELAELIRGINCHVNLIPVNPIKERDFVQPDGKAVQEFKNKLEKCRINVTIRREMGRDIDGACGQLRKRFSERQDS